MNTLPFTIKFETLEYQTYLIQLTKYLTNYYKKTHPLVDFKTEVQCSFDETFEEEWGQGSLFGWELVLNDLVMPSEGQPTILFCKPCNKLF